MEFLSQHDIPFSKHSVKDEGVVEEIENLVGQKTAPVIKVDDQAFIGFAKNRKEIEKLVLS